MAGLIVLAPVGVWLLAWLTFQPHRITRQREATRLIAEFHQRFNEHDLDAICRDAFTCSELPSLRQDWQALLENTRNRVGIFRGVIRSDIRVYIEPPGVRANIVSSFEKGELREIFEMKEFEGPLKIVTYQTVTEEKPTSSR
jgi:hypothetical protein